MEGSSSFRDVVILQTKNFNMSRRCGLIVAKCKHHPFVIKLFIEHPQSYFDPYCKGVESIAFFFAAGGVNRHCAGLSRIINLHTVQDTIKQMPEWSSRIIFPRKWLWIAENQTYLHFKGYNLIPGAILENSIPSIFAIIADEITMKDLLQIPLTTRKKIIMQLCNQLNLAIDPHVPNFVFKKASTAPFTISILDTEHFPTMVNLHKPPHFKSYCSWYTYLIFNFFSKTLFRYKNEGIALSEPLFKCTHSLPKCR